MRHEWTFDDGNVNSIGTVVLPNEEIVAFWETATVPDGKEDGATVIDTRGVAIAAFVVLCPPAVMAAKPPEQMMAEVGIQIADHMDNMKPPEFPTS